MKHKRKRPCDSLMCTTSKKAHTACQPTEPSTHHHYLSLYRNQPINFKDLAAVDVTFSEAWEKLQRRQRESRRLSDPTVTDRAKVTCVGRANDGGGKQSFSTHVDREFNMALTRALLLRDFHLLLPYIPSGYLCPPLPNRLNYVCWVRELLDKGMECDPPEHDEDLHGRKECTTQKFFYQGIDIGTGATCIYPLLLSTPVFSGNDNSTTQWKFLATDVDPTSVQSAIQNIKANNLQKRIHVVCVPKTMNSPSFNMLQPYSNEQKANDVFCSFHQGPILTAMNAATESGMFSFGEGIDNASQTLMMDESISYPCFDFVMTNPPFYSTYHEADGYRTGDGRQRTEMTKSEAVYEGGEYAFISDMIHDSMALRSRITWYTSMTGKKTTLRQVEKKLRSIGFGRANIRTTEFIQGKTRRWGIAWTFQELPERLVALKMKPLPLVKFTININHMRSQNALDEVLSRILKFCQLHQQNNLRYNQVTCNSNENIIVTIKSDKSVGGAAEDNFSSQNDSFLMDIIFLQKPKLLYEDDELCSFHASCNAYSHSSKGDVLVRKTLEELIRYVCQTSRYWRRLQGKTKNDGLNTATSGIGEKSTCVR